MTKSFMWIVVFAMLLWAMLLNSGCTTDGITVDYAKSGGKPPDLSTYSWLVVTPGKVKDPRINAPHLDSVVRDAVDAELKSKGYEKIVGGTPSFQVTYHAVIKEEVETKVLDNYCDYDWAEMYAGESFEPPKEYHRKYEKGTLVLDFSTPHDSRLYWRGSASAEVHLERSQEERDARIREAVHLILKRFPSRN